MKAKTWLFMLFSMVLFSMSQAHATDVFISAGPSGWGCTTCYGGPAIFGSGPGTVVTLTNPGESGPLQLTLPAGVYAIANAAPTGDYAAWRYNGGDNWAWNFVIAKDLGGNLAQVLYVGWGGDRNYSSASDIIGDTLPTYYFQTVLSASTTLAKYYGLLTLSETTTLDFFVIDGYLPDNIGGVGLSVTSVSVPAPTAGAGWPMGIVGIAGLAFWRRCWTGDAA